MTAEEVDALLLVKQLIKGYEDTADSEEGPTANNAMRAGWILDELIGTTNE